MHIPDQKRKKLDKKLIGCIFVGCPVRRKEYFVLVTMNPETIGTSELNRIDSWKNVRSDQA